MTIPDSVTSIGDSTFRDCTGLTSVTIGNGVISIDSWAFCGCTGLTSVTIPNSVTSIGDSAFYDCNNLTGLLLGNNVANIGNSTFYNCSSLTDLEIPDSVISIGEFAFYGSHFGDIFIPERVNYIGRGALTSWYSPAKITVDESNLHYSSDEYGVLYNKDKTELIRYPTGNPRSSFSIPNTVQIVADYAFFGSDYLTVIEFSDTVKCIGEYSFYGCEVLINVFLGNGVKSIGDNAFGMCKNFQTITISESTTCIGDYAFANCDNLKIVVIFSDVSNIGSGVFIRCDSLTDVFFVGSKEQWDNILIGDDNDILYDNIKFDYEYERPFYAVGFCGDNLSWTLYADGELLISGVGAMYDYNYIVPEEKAPWYSIRFSIKKITVEDGINNIGSAAFYGCRDLISITIPNTVTSIGDYAFFSCMNLNSIKIPDSITSIGDYVFSNCDSLTEVHYMGDIAEWCGIDFGDYDTLNYNKLYINGELLQGNITVPKGVVKIGNGAFKNCEGITSITFSEGVTTIGDYVFHGCDSLTSVTIPDSVTSIGNYAFYRCKNLTDVYYLGSREQWDKISIGNDNSALTNATIHFVISGECGNSTTWMFDFETGELIISGKGKMTDYSSSSPAPWDEYRSSIKKITVESGVTSIGNDTFWGCENLVEVILHEGLTKIGNTAFRDCTALTNVTIPDSVTSLGYYAFYGCTGFEDFVVGNGVKTIGNHAFRMCKNLKKITLPVSLTTVSNNAFTECTALAIVVYQGTLLQWNSITIAENNTALVNAILIYKNPEHSSEFVEEVIVIEPTCTTEGTKALRCTVCGEFHELASVPATGHTEGEWIVEVEPTCMSNGSKCTKCIVCGAAVQRIPMPSISHTVGDWEITVQPTTTTTGLKVKKCTYCNNIMAQEVIPVITAANGTCGAGLTWQVDLESETLIISGYGAMTDYKYASSAPWYQYRASIKNIIIEDGATTIGNSAFEGYTNLASITIPDSVTSIGEYTFYGCKAINVLTLGDGVETIGMYAFGGCTGLAEVSFGKSISVINKNAFYGCSKIKTVNYNGTQEQWEKVTIEANNAPITNATKNFKTPEHNCEFGEWVVTVVPTTTNSGTKTHTCSICGAAEIAELPSLSIETAEQVTISFNTGIISGFDSGLSSLDSYITMNSTIYTLSYESNNGKFGTGSKAILKDGDTAVAEYTILVYGDTNGDSWYDGTDAVIVSCLANGMLTKDDVSEAVYMAADCNHDGVIDQLDVDLLNQAGTLLANVDQSKPSEVLLETSSEYVEYISLIDQSPEIEIEDETDAADTPEADTENDNEQTDVPDNEDEEPTTTEFELVEMLMSLLKKVFSFIQSLFAIKI